MMNSYEPVRLFTVKEAIDFIHKFQGLACIAHPWLCSNALDVCKNAYELQIDGIECFPPKHHSAFGTNIFVNFAQEHGLICSGGSDFHSIEDCSVDVGNNIFPEEFADAFLSIMKKHEII